MAVVFPEIPPVENYQSRIFHNLQISNDIIPDDPTVC